MAADYPVLVLSGTHSIDLFYSFSWPRVFLFYLQVTIMVVVMISCFLVAWTPYSAFALYVAAGNEDKVSPLMGTAPSLFAKACTVYNPIIYFLLNKQVCEIYELKYTI